MNLDNKIKFYNGLLTALTKGVKLLAMLRDGSLQEEAKQVEKRNERLAKAAAAVRRKISEQWSEEAEAAVDGLGDASSKLQGQIRALEKSLANGERIVKAIGYIDDIVKIASKVAD